MSPTQENVDLLQPLLDSHLAFIASHRGRLRYHDHAIEVVGDADFLSCWIPTDESADPPDAVHTVRTVPWSGGGWPERLRTSGFEPAEALLYMEAPIDSAFPGGSTGDMIEVGSPADALTFADVQVRGFVEETGGQEAWWRDTVERMALKNYGDPHQSFYLMLVDNDPAAVTLAVRTGSVVGIYAVATVPAHRRHGLASTLLERARTDAIRRGGERLTLQVFEGSYAERLYRKLGFTPAFRSPAYRRPA